MKNSKGVNNNNNNYYYYSFSHQRELMVFHWRLSDSRSPQVSRTLLSILAVFNNAVVLMVSTRSPTSKYSRPFNNPLVTVPKAPFTIGIIVTFMFHSFFNSLARSRYLSLFSHFTFFQFYSVVRRDSKVDNFADFLFCCCWLLWAHKWCTPMDPHIWPGKSRTTSTNIHSADMWGYGM